MTLDFDVYVIHIINMNVVNSESVKHNYIHPVLYFFLFPHSPTDVVRGSRRGSGGAIVVFLFLSGED